jgi:hypothetical protein
LEICGGFLIDKLKQKQIDNASVIALTPDLGNVFDKQYHKTMAHYSSEMYDSYLKLNDQQDGIISYSNVAKSARLLEKSRLIHQIKLINLP